MVKSLLRSFAGGEITPEMQGRIDLAKNRTGLKTARNFITLAHGPAARRPGWRFINEGYDSGQRICLVPFVWSADQAVMLEFGHFYIRFHTGAGTVLEATKTVTGVTQASPGVVTAAGHGFSNGQTVYMGPVTGMTTLSNSYYYVAGATANTFTLQHLDLTPVDTTALPAFSGTANVARVYTLASPYSGSDVFNLNFAQDSDVLTLTNQGFASRELRRLGAANWALVAVNFSPTVTAPTGLGVVPTVPTATNLSAQSYVVTTIDADGITESLATSPVSTSNNLNIAGNFNTISWSAVTGATRYNVYKLRGGVFGFIGQTTGLSIVDDNILADTLQVPPENVITLNSGAGDYPAAVTHHEQRRWFAGTVLQPQTVWGTRTGTTSNLTSSLPSRADDAMEFRIASRQQNAIRHLLPLADLLALTAGGEFRIFADGAPAITPTSLSVKPQAYCGAASVQPALTSSTILYVQAQGSRVRELGYGGQEANSNYKTIDLSLLAPHLFNGHRIMQLAYTRAPDQMLWAVRSDGVLLGLTYVPDQQVYGWHQHNTDGFFESVAVIPEGNEDVLFAVVRRRVGDRQVRFIERLDSRLFIGAANAFFVDSGLTYRGAPVTTLRGLRHLEGKTVQILADGAVKTPQVVVNGAVTIDTPASVVHAGLGYLSDLETLPQSYEKAPAQGQGTMKNVSKVWLRVFQSSLVKAGPTFNKLRQYPARTVDDAYGSPPGLLTAELGLTIDPSWNSDGTVCVRQDEPLPLTVLAVALETATGG